MNFLCYIVTFQTFAPTSETNILWIVGYLRRVHTSLELDCQIVQVITVDVDRWASNDHGPCKRVLSCLLLPPPTHYTSSFSTPSLFHFSLFLPPFLFQRKTTHYNLVFQFCISSLLFLNIVVLTCLPSFVMYRERYALSCMHRTSLHA